MGENLDYETITDKEGIDLMKASAGELLVIDVRDASAEDGDYAGGNIKGCVNVSFSDFVDKLPEILSADNVSSRKTVVLASLSGKNRSPNCFRYYKKARELLSNAAAAKEESAEDDFSKIVASIKLDDKQLAALKAQDLRVLKGGMAAWINYHKDDKEVTADFDAKMWVAGVNDGVKLCHVNDEQ